MSEIKKVAINSCIVGLLWIVCAQANAQLTVTERLIQQEVVRLGGDWESGEKPTLVGFLGGKFQSKHFEMLTHLSSVKIFAAHDCAIDSAALACISQVRQLERIDIVRCRLESESFSSLKTNRELDAIYFESTAVPDKLIDELSQLIQLKKIRFDDCDGLTERHCSQLRNAIPKIVIETTSSSQSDQR